MTTLTIEIKDKDANLLKEFLGKIGAKITVEPSSKITAEILEALKEVKEIQAGIRKPLSLNDI